MKTTKHQRETLGAWIYWVNKENPPGDWLEILDAIGSSLDDLDTLEAKCAWQAELLERARGIVPYVHASDSVLPPVHKAAFDWLADYEEFRKKRNGE